MDEDGSSVDDRVFVVAGGEASPLLGVAEPAFDYVAVLVIGGVEDDRPAASRAATFAVPLLVSGFRDDGLDAALAQLRPGRAGRVRFVSADRIRSRPRSPDLRPTRNCSGSGNSIGESPAWPGVISVIRGSPLPSTS